MAYTPISWEDYPSVNTPVSASNLNHMDTQIKANADDIEDIKDDITTLNNNLANKLDVLTSTDVFGGNVDNIRGVWDVQWCNGRDVSGTPPFTTGYFVLITMRAVQIAISTSTTIALYRRIYVNGAWANWLKVNADQIYA